MYYNYNRKRKVPTNEMNLLESPTRATMNSKKKNLKTHFLRMRNSERIAWIIVCFQMIIITSNRTSWTEIHKRSNIRGGGSSSTSADGIIITTETDPISLLMNDHTFQHYDELKKQNLSKPFYDVATIHAEKAGLVSRIWHSNGSPSVNPNLQTGSCWCGADNW
jgi:hypothetical protein